MNSPALLRRVADDRRPATGEMSTHARSITPISALKARLQAIEGKWSLTNTRDILLQRRWTWTNAQLLIADVPVNRDIARQWLPPALELPGQTDARAAVFIAHYPDTAMGFAYREAGVLLHARLRNKPVLHCAWMVVDDDTAMILGRELLGFPKKMARIDFDFAPLRPEASVVRRGVELLRFEGVADGDGARTPAFAHPIVNMRGIPGALPNLMLSITAHEQCHVSNALRLRIRTQESACDPLASLGIDGEFSARRMVLNIGGKSDAESRFPIAPAAMVNPAWLWKAYPFRTW